MLQYSLAADRPIQRAARTSAIGQPAQHEAQQHRDYRYLWNDLELRVVVAAPRSRIVQQIQAGDVRQAHHPRSTYPPSTDSAAQRQVRGWRFESGLLRSEELSVRATSSLPAA